MKRTTLQPKGSTVNQNSKKVMGIAIRGVQNAEAAFAKVEKKLGSLKGRKFYGLLYGPPEIGEYFACVEILPSDDPKSLGLETRVIPVGKYARRKIRYWPEDMSIIGRGFTDMITKTNLDPTRPTIEFYRSERDLHIFVPIK